MPPTNNVFDRQSFNSTPRNAAFGKFHLNRLLTQIWSVFFTQKSLKVLAWGRTFMSAEEADDDEWTDVTCYTRGQVLELDGRMQVIALLTASNSVRYFEPESDILNVTHGLSCFLRIE